MLDPHPPLPPTPTTHLHLLFMLDADAQDMDSLPGSVAGAQLPGPPQKALVHGAFARAASVHKIGGFPAILT